MGDHIVEEVINSSHQLVNLVSELQNLRAVNNNNGSEAFVATVSVDESRFEHVFNWIELKRVVTYFPFVVSYHHGGGNIILPFLTLEYSQNESAIVIIALRDCDLVLFAVVTELFQMCFFFFFQLNFSEN